MTVKLAAMIAATLVATGTAAGSVVPAMADPTDDPNDQVLPEGVPEGIFAYHQEGGEPDVWTVMPLCVHVVGEGRVPLKHRVGCKLQVESEAGVAGSFRLVGDRWSMTTLNPGGLECSDGTTTATDDTYAFDLALNGELSSAHNYACGQQPGIDRKPFTLAFVSPLPNPVIHYPLHCQDNIQHLCS